MKGVFFWLVLLSSGCYSQTDTFYLQDNYIDYNTHAFVNNCYFLTYDHQYQVIQWERFLREGQESFQLTGNDYVILDSIDNRLLCHFWHRGDTSYYESYFDNGNLYESRQHYFTPEPYVYEKESRWFYSSGQLKVYEKLKDLELADYKYYYPNGTLRAEGQKYFSNPNDFFGPYKEYYPNGALAVERVYTLPDLSDSLYKRWYKKSALLSESYFDLEGNITTDTSWKTEYLPIYEKFPHPEWRHVFGDSLYSWGHFIEQEGYNDNLSALKTELFMRFELPKKCNCRKGIIWVSFVVRKDGSIAFDGIEFPNAAIRDAMQKAIESLEKWPPGIYNGSPVDTQIVTYLILDQ